MSVAVLMVCATVIDTLDECLHLAHQAEERRFLAEDDDDQERLARIRAEVCPIVRGLALGDASSLSLSLSLSLLLSLSLALSLSPLW
jgi:hypothetical protein